MIPEPSEIAVVGTEDSVSIQCIMTLDEFHQLEVEWGDLLEKSTHSTVFNSWEWLFSWWQAYSGDGLLRIVVLRSKRTSGVIGIAPMYIHSRQVVPGIRCNLMRLIGDGSEDSDYLDFLVHPDYVRSVFDKFVHWLWNNHEWDAIELNTLPEHSALPKQMERMAKAQKLLLRHERQIRAKTNLPDSMQAFLSHLRPRFRTKVRSLLRKFDQYSDLVFEFDNEDLENRLSSLFDLHELRWLGKGRSGVFKNAAKRRFYQKFVPRFAQKGWLRFYSLRQGEKYTAHQMCFGREGCTLLLQEGFDITDRAVSHGQMLRGIIFRHLIEKGEKAYDFLGGYSKHKADWGAVECDMVRLIISRRNFKGSIYFNLPIWRENLAPIAKKFVPEMILKRLRPAE